MHVLLVYPRFPKTFWSYEKIKDDIIRHISIAKYYGKPVAVGGPYPTSMPEEMVAAGADYLILDEGEITLPMFVAALERGEKQRGYPFRFDTEASLDLAQDQELIDLMLECNFAAVFMGIETPDTESLAVTKKFQNTRSPLLDAIDTVTRSGLRVIAGFIIGFDGEKAGAGQRIVDFAEATGIPTTTFAMLQALPHTALWHRLDKEGRLIEKDGNINQTTLMNFVPTRPVEEIAQEYVEAFCQLYEPHQYLNRVYRYFLKLGAPRVKPPFRWPEWVIVRALLIVIWRQGIRRSTRWAFWHHLVHILLKNPGVVEQYLAVCAHNEHFLEYRDIVRQQIADQLAALHPSAPHPAQSTVQV